jgi:hypothetical protein
VSTAPVIESRKTTGLVDPRSVGTNVWPARGGLAVHWGGDHQGITTTTTHNTCQARLRSWQDFHMNGRGWVDLAYNWVVCQHGRLMVGRGWGVRSAANGTNDANDRYLACCWMGGSNDGAPTGTALAAIEWLTQELRRRGAGWDVQPHQHFFGTDCPGSVLVDCCGVWRKMTGPSAIPAFPLPAGWYFGPRSGPRESVSGFYGHRMELARWQATVGLVGDGLYGPRTAAAARRVQTSHHLDPDALIGPLTWKAAWS